MCNLQVLENMKEEPEGGLNMLFHTHQKRAGNLLGIFFLGDHHRQVNNLLAR
jgi:hypothetical protein